MSADPLAANRIHRVRVGVGAAVVLVLVGLGVAVLVSAVSAAGGTRTVIEAPGSVVDGVVAEGELVVGEPERVTIFVHILGEVRRPGLVQLREGDRVIDALAAAGGYTDAADRAFLNLARVVSDGEQLVVYAEGEAPEQVGGTAGTNGGVVTGKVNLNTADGPTLETLPRVGPALAARIIQWRETNGRFRTIEDLMSVSGIGEKTFAGLRDLVTV
ncbi:MAG TPA: helix-hairpin-helix domain-containing protein [Terrimesophilobacter sp.]|nr:helix-hairpin-helix domain-containing protein [Terrimesophilobacter sp.]